ncbi:glucosaminidase domain-containing protein [Burkholderia sp. Ac-20345]|uniref:glucosaminidase domain-containing protein n=1 Tax=Burkholderia sp. Ac-20345 TaxID=2703891 RepID=UPI00197BA281|nr:glucosaminidase domain-containing protein [Burkholderia sp. Ac-20345]MBN3777450.1 glucosaminidase domain-containing protein [Burkholderia sp. Ac-20345]
MGSPKDQFVRTYGAVAQRAGEQLGVAPNVLLTQWGLETGWGKSVIPGTNNLGNIKDFSGGGVRARDNATGSNDAYRAYATPNAFADDYAAMIQRRYPNAVGAGGDVGRFATALKQGGYAEDPRYVSKMATTYGALTGTPVAASGISDGAARGAAGADDDMASMYGIDPNMMGGAAATRVSMAPGSISKPLLDQQTALDRTASPQGATAQQTTVPDWGSWVDSYVKSIVKNA